MKGLALTPLNRVNSVRVGGANFGQTFLAAEVRRPTLVIPM
jgi:hypothetical protein